jgi:hypothetical protein
MCSGRDVTDVNMFALFNCAMILVLYLTASRPMVGASLVPFIGIALELHEPDSRIAKCSLQF